jgi:C-terminal processing protease CtpA/Prc
MQHFTRRTVLAGASAAVATACSPMSVVRPAAANAPCMTESLKAFRQRAELQSLIPKERDMLVGQAIDLLDQFYAHLPKKIEQYKIDPVGSLKALRQKVGKIKDAQFHTELGAIFESLHDLHTGYFLPAPYSKAHCWLPFKVEAYFEPAQNQGEPQPKYIVSRVLDGFEADPNFVAGVEIVSWGGMPIEQAADNIGVRGANPGARRALGLARLTYRFLFRNTPPQEDSVVIRYRTGGGEEREIEIPWSVSLMPGECGDSTTACTEVEQLQAFRRFLFAPYTTCNQFLPKLEPISTPDGDFGYIRIFTFERLLMNNDDEFVKAFQAQVERFAANTRGLIIDIRDNGGGATRAAERCAQLVRKTDQQFEPLGHYFRATQDALHLCQLEIPEVTGLVCGGMKEQIQSIQQAIDSTQTFSKAFNYTCPSAVSRIYKNPVIVVTSALSYSSAEFFAAGFKDHGGFILGVDETTGGGGANYRAHSDLHSYFVKANKPSPLQEICNDKGMFSVAFRRSTRVGLGAGKDIEDNGVECSERYRMTRNDLLNQNIDLKMHAAKLLAKMQ